MNIALDGETPYDNGDLFRYLQKHMSVMKSTTFLPWKYRIADHTDNAFMSGLAEATGKGNSAFYTTDGMRFEFFSNTEICTTSSNYYPYRNYLHESGLYSHICTTLRSGSVNPIFKCGSYGLANNPNNLTATPCMIAVDVNGDRKPYPANINATTIFENTYNSPAPNAKKVKDLFSIIITEDKAIPYGVVAQKAMYQGQK